MHHYFLQLALLSATFLLTPAIKLSVSSKFSLTGATKPQYGVGLVSILSSVFSHFTKFA
jgi:hypothetical protein